MEKDLHNLPPPERLSRYRELATEADAFAASMITTGLRDSYRIVARHWRELASDLEKPPKAGKVEAPERHLPQPTT